MARKKPRVFHLDNNKVRLDLLQFRALWYVGAVATFGIEKYGDRNWEAAAGEGLWKWGQLLGSALRHLFAWAMRQDLDPESGLPHLAHAAWNILSLLEIVLCGVSVDDRSWLLPAAPVVSRRRKKR